MDIFNRKRVRELEYKLKGIEDENGRLRTVLNDAEDRISLLLNLKSKIPEDCKPGEYCKVCAFAKEYRYRNHVVGFKVDRSYDYYSSGYICRKAVECKNFIQKKEEET